MSSADKRSVSTDALETLGTIIDCNQGRDAVHIAVEPVEAGEILRPSDPVCLIDGRAYLDLKTRTPVGIVDPFLSTHVHAGQWFWLMLSPRTITSLRHVWIHPDFPEEDAKSILHSSKMDKKEAETWLREFCDGASCPSYETLIRLLSGERNCDDLDDLGVTFDDEYLTVLGQDAHGFIPPKFWDCVEVITGRTFPRAEWFSCSC